MRKQLFIIGFILLMSISLVNAQQLLTEPFTTTLTPENNLGFTLDQIRANENIRSCADETFWSTGSCSYAYFCGAILSSTSTSIDDALFRECKEITDATTTSITINEFIPPKGVLYFVVSFATIVDYTFDDVTEVWNPVARIPESLIQADSIRNVCTAGQMLYLDPRIGGYKCFLSTRICLDTQNTGFCTNVHTLWVLDLNEDGIITDAELDDASNFCADRATPDFPDGDLICDTVVDLECADLCSLYDANGVCITSGGNGICDIFDIVADTSCRDSPLSPNSRICDEFDAEGCLTVYDPVCVGTTTYPNSCVSEAQSIFACPTGTTGDNCYVPNTCTPEVVQCFAASDCPNVENICLGGSITGIDVVCVNNLCAYSGQCGNLNCNSDSDCSLMGSPCIGVTPTCSSGNLCGLTGKCIEKPAPVGFNIFDLIANIFNAFIAFIRSLFV